MFPVMVLDRIQQLFGVVADGGVWESAIQLLAMAEFARRLFKRTRSTADGREGREDGRRGAKLDNVLLRSFFPLGSTLGYDISLLIK